MAILKGNIIEWKDVKAKLASLIASVADNVPNSVDVSNFGAKTLLNKLFLTAGNKQFARRIVTQNALTINSTGVSTATVKADIENLFESNKYILTPNKTIIAVDDMYNIAYVIYRFLNDSMHIYVSPYYKKKIIIYHSPASTAYGKPEIVDNSYTASQFSSFLNNLIGIMDGIKVSYNTYKRGIKFLTF